MKNKVLKIILFIIVLTSILLINITVKANSISKQSIHIKEDIISAPGFNYGQGFAMSERYYFTSSINVGKGEVGKIFVVKKENNKEITSVDIDGNHVNDMTFDNLNKCLVITKFSEINDKSTMKVYKFDKTTNHKLYDLNINLNHCGAGIAYNSTYKIFIMRRGNKILLYDYNGFYTGKSAAKKYEIKETKDCDVRQGIGTYKNYVYICYNKLDSENNYKKGIILVMNLYTGEIEEELVINKKEELESCDFDKEGNLYLYYGKNRIVRNTDYKYSEDNNLKNK